MRLQSQAVRSTVGVERVVVSKNEERTGGCSEVYEGQGGQQILLGSTDDLKCENRLYTFSDVCPRLMPSFYQVAEGGEVGGVVQLFVLCTKVNLEGEKSCECPE